MKQSKIIYGDGVVERGVFADAEQAREYAAEQARQRGTYVRSQSAVAGAIKINATNGGPNYAK